MNTDDAWNAIVSGYSRTAEERKQHSLQVASQPAPGFYKDRGTVFHVKHSKAGHWYALEAVTKPGGNRIRWEYAGQRATIRPQDRLTPEEAGRYTAHCVMCGYRLDTPESRERGIGPVCAKRMANQ